ncbi:hypothetical protein [Deinococcus multiflagellatus]|uniref:MalT-like TPR region domain-containing protein n=1 Tax=Deinococcus multiflagellatus TaxID=1656887 RepID=A0ABW1ZSD3_9DEIO
MTTAPLSASSSDPRAPRWGGLIRDIQLHRLTRVVAPAGYNKSAFATFIYDTVPRAHRITFSHAHTSLHGALTHLSQSLQLDHVQFELPGLLSSRARLSPSQFARVLQQDMAHPSLDGLMLILDDVHLLESNAAAVLVQIATAPTRRVNVVACVRHPDEFPADLHYGMPVVDITERELAYTADELRDVADHADPYGYPALAHAVRSGLSAGRYMRRLLALIDEDLLLELCRAALIPVWPLSPEQARTLDVRPLLVRDALAADLPIIRTDPTTEQYVPHPELAAALLAILKDNEQQFRDAHARLSRLSAANDPVLAVRHAMLARESDRAAEIAVEWLSRSDDVAGTLNDDLLLTLVPVETLLPPTLRLRLATTLSQHGQHTEALGILGSLRGQRTPDAADPEEVHLGFARVYAATGAYAKAFEEIQQAVVSERPFIRAFAAHLVITMHARSGEEQVARNVGSLDDARRWSESALQQLSRQDTASTDAELMALCVQVYLGHWEERSMLHLRARLELLLLREQFEHPETGHALLLLHRLMTDHGLGTLAVSPLESARRLLALTPDAQAALLCAEAREALRQADPESAAGTLLVARESFQGTDPYLRTEIELLLTCALYTLADTPADVLQQAARTYAVAAAATPRRGINSAVQACAP